MDIQDLIINPLRRFSQSELKATETCNAVVSYWSIQGLTGQQLQEAWPLVLEDNKIVSSLLWSIPQYCSHMDPSITEPMLEQLAFAIKSSTHPNIDLLMLFRQWSVHHNWSVTSPHSGYDFYQLVVNAARDNPQRFEEVVVNHASAPLREELLANMIEQSPDDLMPMLARALSPFDDELSQSGDVSLEVALCGEYGNVKTLQVLSDHLPLVLNARIDASLRVLSEALSDHEKLMEALGSDPTLKGALKNANKMMVDIQIKTLLSFFPFMDQSQGATFVRTCIDNDLKLPAEVAAAVSRQDLLNHTQHLTVDRYKTKKM